MKAQVRGDKPLLRALTFAGACAALSACGGAPIAPSSGDPPAGVVPITSFAITAAAPVATVPLPAPFTAQLWAVTGQSSQLASVANASTDVTGQSEWRSSNTAVASVSATGLLTAHRAGQAPLTAVYQGRAATTLLTVFSAPVATTETFTGVLPLRERRPYVATVEPGGGDVVFVLTSSGAGSALLGVMFGPLSGSTCSPPYTYGTSWIASEGAATGARSDARAAAYQVPPGQYCVIVLDPATATPDDRLPPFATLTPMNAPVNYRLTVAVSGAGGSVVTGRTIPAGSIR